MARQTDLASATTTTSDVFNWFGNLWIVLSVSSVITLGAWVIYNVLKIAPNDRERGNV